MRCRKGDMAIMVVGESIGKMVEVGNFLGIANNPIEHPGDDYWAVEYRGIPWNKKLQWLIARDSHMIPIRPGDLQETEEKEREAVE